MEGGDKGPHGSGIDKGLKLVGAELRCPQMVDPAMALERKPRASHS